MNAKAGRREVHRACGPDCYSLDQIMISPLVSKVNLFGMRWWESDFHRVENGLSGSAADRFQPIRGSSGIGSCSRRLTLISDVLPSEQECASSNSLDSGDTACSGAADPISQGLGGSLQLSGHEPNHESMCRPIAGRRHPYANGSEVRQGLTGNQCMFFRGIADCAHR
jgi:hypothetical protein